jgi:hypothetical protein
MRLSHGDATGFVRETEAKCKEKLKDDFDTFTKVIDWDLINGLQEMCVFPPAHSLALKLVV